MKSTTEAGMATAGEGTLALIPTFIVVAVDATGMGIILPLLPFYSQRLGATPFLLGRPDLGLCRLPAHRRSNRRHPFGSLRPAKGPAGQPDWNLRRICRARTGR